MKLTKLYNQWHQIRGYIFALLIIAVIAERITALVHFGVVYTDSDQTIMWYAAAELKTGHIHTPLFYGQNYNTHFESMLAVPLLWTGLPYYMALPVVTNILAVFPFLFLAILLYKNRQQNAAITVLAIALALPTAYVLQTGLPRGFVTGIFAISLAFPALFSHKTKWFFSTGLLLPLAYILNPNSVFVALPLLAILFTQNLKNPRFYTTAVSGLLIGGAVWYFLNQYYRHHPQLVIHGMHPIVFSGSLFKESLVTIDQYFNFITPFLWKTGAFVLAIQLIPLGYLLYKKQYLPALMLLLIIGVQVASLSITKITDGRNSIFFPYSRMFLALPLLVALVFYYSQVAAKNGFAVLMAVAAIITFCIKQQNLKPQINDLVYGPPEHIVDVRKIEQLRQECSTIDSAAVKYNAGLVLVQSKGDYINYGCPCMIKNFPPTLRPSYERRRWRMIEEQKKLHSNILIIEYGDSLWQQRMNADTGKYLRVQQELYLLQHNNQNALQVAKQLGWH